jgi:hypothetical protein
MERNSWRIRSVDFVRPVMWYKGRSWCGDGLFTRKKVRSSGNELWLYRCCWRGSLIYSATRRFTPKKVRSSGRGPGFIAAVGVVA